MRRTSFFILLFVLFYWSVSLAADIPNAPTNFRIGEPPVPFPREFSVPRSVSRTSGVAPLSVHFTAGFSDSSPTERGFHNYDYSWNFGDPSSGIWGTSEKSKNEAKGPVAAHVFETPGSYTVTLTVRDASGVVDTDTFNITVADPDIVYSGTNTTCICDTTQNNFTGCPAGARQVATDDLSTITGYADAGERILFHRGSSWTTGEVSFPNNSGPVTLGAYGTGTNPDDQGIYSNAPHITVTSGARFITMSNKQDWRISNLYISGAASITTGIFGVTNFQRILLLRNKIRGFVTGVIFTHYNERADDLIDQLVVASCNISDSNTNQMYLGAERLALLGNIAKDSSDSHVVRVWQGYKGVISHNIFSGSTLNVDKSGRHALKFHGPSDNKEDYCTPAAGNGCLANRTIFAVISDNVFGSSGPWPVAIGPIDSGKDTRVSDVIFERNRIHPDYGSPSQKRNLVQVGIMIWARYVTVRNNIIDGTGGYNGFIGMMVSQRGIEPTPLGVEVYNNVIYRSDDGTGTQRGIIISSEADATIIRNNLVAFPNFSGSKTLIDDSSSDLVSSNNLMTDAPGFVDPNNANPLLRDYSPLKNSIVDEAGDPNIPVYDDYELKRRLQDGAYDIGAFEN